MAWRVRELLQPVQLGLAGEQFVGAVADAVGAFAAVEAVVVEIRFKALFEGISDCLTA